MLLDVHAHPPAMWRPNDVEHVEHMVRAYVEGLVRYDARAVVSQLRPAPGAPADLLPWERLHSGNAYVADLVRRYPDRLLGHCTTHPGYPTQALAELELRLVKQSDQFACLKMHSLAFCDDPSYDPLMEFCARPGGYVDASSLIGEWPGRRLNGSPPPPREMLMTQRLRLMDQVGIRRAAVGLLDGVLLKDASVANAEAALGIT